MATVRIHYEGPEALVGALTQRLEREGVTVERIGEPASSNEASRASPRPSPPD